MKPRLLFAAALLWCAAATPAQAADGAEQYEIRIRYQTTSEGEGSSGSSSGGNLYREDVYPAEGECRTRRFDVVDDPERKRPLGVWEMPVEVRDCAGQARVIANREAMVARRDAYLAAAKIPRESCGRYYFSWNVFKIECDPDAILETVAGIDLGSIRLEDGAVFTLPDTDTSVTLTVVPDAPAGQRIFKGRRTIDPEMLREGAIETIMVVAEVRGKVVTREEAMAQIAAHQFSGEAEVTLVEEPAAGRITATFNGSVREVDAEGGVETRQGETVITRQRAEDASQPDPAFT